MEAIETIEQTSPQEIIAAFNYMILRLSLQYVENKDPQLRGASMAEKFVTFNGSNDFSARKCDVFPFLVTTGNGHLEELLSFFNSQFVIVKHGPQSIKVDQADILKGSIFEAVVQRYVHSYLEDKETLQKTLISANDYFAIINVQEIGAVQSVDELKKIVIAYFQINEKSVRLAKIFTSIDESIKHINENRLRGFANLDYEILSAWTKRNSVFSSFQQFFEPDGTPVDNDEEVITIFNLLISSSEFELQPG